MLDLVTDFNRNDSKQNLWDILKSLTGEYCIKIERKKKRRSINQNKYYWGVVLPYLCDFTGYSELEMHLWLKHIYLPYIGLDDHGFWSTAVLTTEQFEEYLELIRSTVSLTFGFEIPLPNEVIMA